MSLSHLSGSGAPVGPVQHERPSSSHEGSQKRKRSEQVSWDGVNVHPYTDARSFLELLHEEDVLPHSCTPLGAVVDELHGVVSCAVAYQLEGAHDDVRITLVRVNSERGIVLRGTTKLGSIERAQEDCLAFKVYCAYDALDEESRKDIERWSNHTYAPGLSNITMKGSRATPRLTEEANKLVSVIQASEEKLPFHLVELVEKVLYWTWVERVVVDEICVGGFNC